MSDDLPKVDWPRAGDVLFSDALPDGRHNACLNFGGDFWTGYAGGYRKGGRILTDWVMSEGIDHDYLVFPIVFLYHHHLELGMKELIRKGEQFLGNGEDFQLGHNLSAQWTHCRRVIEQVFDDADSEVLDTIGEHIAQLVVLDPVLESFRYPYKSDGVTPTLPKEFQRFNLRHFAECVERIAEVLESLCMGIEVYLEQKTEMMAEMRYQGGI
jgi:hypothetical protein